MEELIEKIKDAPLHWRLIIVLLLGSVSTWYFVFSSDLDLAEYEMVEAENKKQSMEVKYNRAKTQKQDMPQLEEKLAFTNQQMEKAKKNLPDTYEMETILEYVSKSSADTGVDLSIFEPEAEVLKSAGYNYFEMPIRIETMGKYNDTANFFDRLVHMDKMVHVRDMNIEQVKNMVVNRAEQGAAPPNKEARLAMELDSIRIKTVAKMVVFRSARPGEQAATPAPDQEAEEENE